MLQKGISHTSSERDASWDWFPIFVDYLSYQVFHCIDIYVLGFVRLIATFPKIPERDFFHLLVIISSLSRSGLNLIVDGWARSSCPIMSRIFKLTPYSPSLYGSIIITSPMYIMPTEASCYNIWLWVQSKIHRLVFSYIWLS